MPADLGRVNGRNRNPLGEGFFPVPYELMDSGFAREMSGAEFKRYATLLRIANFQGALSFTISLEDLERCDGVSARRAHHVNAKLQERGLVEIDRSCNPYRYTLLRSSEWHKPPVPGQRTMVSRMLNRRRVIAVPPQKVTAPPWG